MKNLILRTIKLISPKRVNLSRLKIGHIVSIEDTDYGEYAISKAVSPIGCPYCGEILHTLEEHDHGPIA
jgi:hypothetical protein